MPKHLSEKQRKAMFAKMAVARAGFKTSQMEETRTQYRFRQQPPSKFQKNTFRTKDIGKPGHIIAITARPKGSTKTRIQTVFIKKTDL